MSPEDTAVSVAWEVALADLEASVAAALCVGPDTNEGLAAWQPPAGLGPIPGHLAARARHVHRLQTSAIAELERRVGSNRAHTAAVTKVSASQAGPRPAYLDIAG